jgi:hypothetical protein
MRLLISLDGISFAQRELTTHIPYTGLVDPPIGNIGLLPIEPGRDFFSLVTDVDFHLQGLQLLPESVLISSKNRQKSWQ